MGLTKSELAAVGILLVAFSIGAYFYPQMPERIACHWDLKGQVNGYMSRPLGLFLVPGILAAIVLSAVLIPRVGSVAANVEGFKRFYGRLGVFLGIFLLAIQYHIILWNLGIEMNPLWVLPVPLAVIVAWVVVRCCRLRRFA